MTQRAQSDPAVLLTVSEVAERLGMSKVWVYQHSREQNPKKPVIPSVRLGSSVRFRWEAVLEFIKEQERGA